MRTTLFIILTITFFSWEELKRCISQNKPFGNEEFVKVLEQKSGLNLTTRKQGRPHK